MLRLSRAGLEDWWCAGAAVPPNEEDHVRDMLSLSGKPRVEALKPASPKHQMQTVHNQIQQHGLKDGRANIPETITMQNVSARDPKYRMDPTSYRQGTDEPYAADTQCGRITWPRKGGGTLTL